VAVDYHSMQNLRSLSKAIYIYIWKMICTKHLFDTIVEGLSGLWPNKSKFPTTIYPPTCPQEDIYYSSAFFRLFGFTTRPATYTPHSFSKNERERVALWCSEGRNRPSSASGAWSVRLPFRFQLTRLKSFLTLSFISSL
jgi:hypothetical protein